MFEIVDQQNGNWLLWLVAGVLIGAISVIVATAQRDKDRDSRRGRPAENDNKSRAARRKAKESQDTGTPHVPDQPRQLIIPPPDEAKIEAVAPKNDMGRRFR